jgi:glutaredoxin
VLTEHVIREYAARTPIKGTVMFGKDNCTYCRMAKELFAEKSVDYHYRDVVKEPAALYEMLARVKPIVGPKTPITTPQIWVDGRYIGGYDALHDVL